MIHVDIMGVVVELSCIRRRHDPIWNFRDFVTCLLCPPLLRSTVTGCCRISSTYIRLIKQMNNSVEICPFHRQYNDIAVLTLDSPVPFSDKIAPICLPDASRRFTGTSATVIGWGSLRESKWS